MSELHFSDSALLALLAALWLSGGALIGALHFLVLRWNVRLFVAGGTPILTLTLQLGRLALLAGALAVVVSRFGAFPLLMATGGILVARTAALHMGEHA